MVVVKHLFVMLTTEQMLGEIWRERRFCGAELIIVKYPAICLLYRRWRILLWLSGVKRMSVDLIYYIPNTGTLRAHNAPFILSSSVPGSRAL